MKDLNFDTITVGECVDLNERGGFVFINDGHITCVVRGDEQCSL
jgi:hypothetical protein